MVGRSLAGALAALLLVIACGGDDGSGNEDSARQQEGDESAESSTTAEPSSSSTSSTAPPTGPQDWTAVMNDLNGRIGEMFANPDPEHVADVISEECQCWDYYFGNVQNLAAEGTHWEEEGRGVLFTMETDRYENGGARLTVRFQVPTIRLVTADGEVLDELPGGPAPACTTVQVVPDGPNGEWRLHQEVSLDGCPDEAL